MKEYIEIKNARIHNLKGSGRGRSLSLSADGCNEALTDVGGLYCGLSGEKYSGKCA